MARWELTTLSLEYPARTGGMHTNGPEHCVPRCRCGWHGERMCRHTQQRAAFWAHADDCELAADAMLSDERPALVYADVPADVLAVARRAILEALAAGSHPMHRLAAFSGLRQGRAKIETNALIAEGLVRSTDYGEAPMRYSITDTGRAVLAGRESTGETT